MGSKQTKNTQKREEKREEKIKSDMKKKWDNFAKTHANKFEPENMHNTEQKTNLQKEQIIKDNSNEQNLQNVAILDLNPLIDKEKQIEQKGDFLPLILPNEIQKNKETDNENQINLNAENNNEIKSYNDNNNVNVVIENINNINKNLKNNENIENLINKKEEEKPKFIIKENEDYENATIENVFHITLDKKNPKKYLYLESFLSKLLSMGQSPSFKLENLDDIILLIMNEPTIKNNLLNYFLDCFHRAYEIIEVSYKDILGPNFSQIHLDITIYFGQIVSSPESFEINITKKEISQIIKDYYLKTSEDEFLFLFKDITLNCGDDIDSLSQILHYLLEIIHMENLHSQTFFYGVAIIKNLNLLLKILRDYPKVREVFLNDILYNPTNVNGRLK